MSTNRSLVANNVIVNCNSAASNPDGIDCASGDYIDYRNNIFLNNYLHFNMEASTGAHDTVNYNAYWPDGSAAFSYYGTACNWATWSSHFDMHGQLANPNFINGSGSFSSATNFRITGASPCANAGVAVSGITTDFGGNNFQNPPSMGAWEWQVLGERSKARVGAKMY